MQIFFDRQPKKALIAILELHAWIEHPFVFNDPQAFAVRILLSIYK
jgi:hypothetical protein